MKTFNSKLYQIKSILERLSGVQDIGNRTRKQEIVELKFFYYKLSRKFTLSSYATIADFLGGYDHATALNGIQTFNDHYESNSLINPEIYKNAFFILEQCRIKEEEKIKSEFIRYEGLKTQYKSRFNNLLNKYRSVIRKKDDKIKRLKEENLDLKNQILESGEY